MCAETSILRQQWLLSYLWGGIYVWSLLPLGVWAGTNARLFQLHIQQRRESRGEQAVAAATNAIGSAVGGVWQALGGGGASATGAQAQTNGPASPATGVPMRPLSRTPSSGSGIV